MGIDAEMVVRTRAEVSERQVIRWAYELAEAFRGAVWTVRPGTFHDGTSYRCLEIVQRYEQDGPPIEPEPGETLIRVRLRGRYYGPDYERGDLPTLIMVARWLEAKISGAAVWYGGDSSGALAEPFGEEQREELWQHFLEHGHRPYEGHFGRGMNAPVCDFCLEPMHHFGGCGPVGSRDAEEFFGCPGCGLHVRKSASGPAVECDDNWKPKAPRYREPQVPA